MRLALRVVLLFTHSVALCVCLPLVRLLCYVRFGCVWIALRFVVVCCVAARRCSALMNVDVALPRRARLRWWPICLRYAFGVVPLRYSPICRLDVVVRARCCGCGADGMVGSGNGGNVTLPVPLRCLIYYPLLQRTIALLPFYRPFLLRSLLTFSRTLRCLYVCGCGIWHLR